MARQLPAHLSYKSALALLPSPNITVPIEAVRRAHDKNFARWPPHINLLYPFLASPTEVAEHGAEPQPHPKQDIHERIEKAVSNIQPFHVSLSVESPGTFHHGPKSKTVWLGPTTQSIQTLQGALQAEFAECNADQRPFKPHLSVGQARNEHGVGVVAEDLRKSMSDYLAGHDECTTLEWYIDKVFVLERKGYKDRFKVVGAIKLGMQSHP